MTKQKNTNTRTQEQEQEQKTLDAIILILQEYEQAKQDKKRASAILQKENVIKMADKINSHAIGMLAKHKDKRGLVHLCASDSDIFKYYLRPFYNDAGITFKKVESGDIKVQVDIECDFNLLQDFQKWAFARLEQNKQKAKEQKQALEKVKTGVRFDKMDKKTLQAIILQAKQALAKIKD